MSKFKVKLKIQGLELEIEGARDEASAISQNIGQQLAGILAPAGGIIEGEVVGLPGSQGSSPAVVDHTPPKKARRRRSVSSRSSEESGSKHIDFRHNPEKYGNPQSDWKCSQKALWLLYVLKEQGAAEGASASVISKTFNRHFRQAKAISPSNVSRDLGRLKSETPVPVDENTTSNPSEWSILDEGVRRVRELMSGVAV